jgi:membrane protein YdbS with pleckstrin-like domain
MAGRSASPSDGTAYDRRPDFLLAMYEQLMADINRHIVVVWQMVSVVGAAIVGLVVADKEGVPTAYATIVALVVIAWVLEHLHDSNYWYNRNLVMITNIERVFLTPDDVDRIHPYFTSHRPARSFLEHLAIQRVYALVVAALVFAYFFARAVYPTLDVNAPFSPSKVLAALVFIAVIARDQVLRGNYEKKYQQYLNISPGIAIDREVDFGATHGKR